MLSSNIGTTLVSLLDICTSRYLEPIATRHSNSCTIFNSRRNSHIPTIKENNFLANFNVNMYVTMHTYIHCAHVCMSKGTHMCCCVHVRYVYFVIICLRIKCKTIIKSITN